MDNKTQGPAKTPVVTTEPVVLPDVATSPHTVTPAAGKAPVNVPQAGAGVLEDALPDINEAARKVGGYKNLAEIAKELGAAETGQ
jgi:hypothetical protein